MALGDTPASPAVQFEKQREAVDLQSTLARLTIAIENLRLMSSQMGQNAALDPVLQQLKQQYGDNSAKIRMEYETATNAWSNQTMGPIMQSLQQTQQQLVTLQQQSLAIQQQAMMYGNRGALPQASMESVPFYAQSIGALRNQYKPMFEQLGYQSGYMDTYYKNLPYENNLKKFGILGTAERPMQSPFLQRLAEEQYQRGLANNLAGSSPRAADIKEYYEYQNEMNSRTQQASLNYVVSSTLGVRGGMVQKPEMNQAYLPAINNLADTLGTSFDQALGVLKKMQELGATAADMKSGKTHDIVAGVNDTIRTLGALSKLLNSEDLTQILSAAENLSRFGAGNFRVGLANVASSLRLTPEQASQVLNKYGSAMDPNQNPYLSALGMNSAGLSMGMYSQRMGQDLKNFGQYNSTAFQRLGGAEGISGMVGATLTNNMMSPGFLMSAMGGGNFFTGANTLTSDMMKDPTKFYLGLNDKIYEQQQKYSGSRGMELIERQAEQLRKDYPMLSREEAMLTMLGGDSNKYSAFKEYEATGAGALDETRKRYQFSGMFGPSIYAPKKYEQYQDTFGRQWNQSAEEMGADMAGSTWLTRSIRESMFGAPIIGAAGSAMTRPAGGFGPKQWTGDWGTSMEDVPGRTWDLIAPEIGTTRVSAEKYNPFQTGFFDAQGKRFVVEEGAGARAYTGSLAKSDITDNRVGTVIASALVSTDTAVTRIQDVLNQILNENQIPSIGHIREVMHSAINAYQSEAGISETVAQEAHTFVSRASIEDIVKNVDALLDPASPAHALIQAIYTGQRDIGRVMRNDEMMGKSMMANIMRSSGVSEQSIQDMGFLAPKTGLRKAAEWMNANKTGMNATSMAISVGMAANGVGIPAAILFEAGSLAVIEGGASVLSGVDDVINIVDTLVGKGVRTKAVMGFAADENATSLEKEIIYIAVIFSAKWSLSTGSFFTSNRVGAISQNLVSIATQYKAAHQKIFAQKQKSTKAANPDATFLSPGDLASVVDSLIRTVGVEQFDGPDKEANARKVYTAIVSMLNDPRSELGGAIRTTSQADIQGTIARDIADAVQKGFDSGQLGYTSGTLDPFTQSIENMLDEGNITSVKDTGLAVSNYLSGKSASADFEKLKEEVTRAVASKGSKDADKVGGVLEKMKAYISGPGNDVSFSASEISALREYDPDMAERLSEVMKSDQPGKKKQESVNRILGELTRKQTDITQSTQQQALYWSQILFAVADMAMNDKTSPGATALRRLMSGESS